MSRVHLTSNWETSHVRGWILGNTKIGPVLDVKVCFHQGRHGVEIMIESLFRDRRVSWVRIVNGIGGYVTETSEEILVADVQNRSAGKLAAKGKSRPKLTFSLSLESIPHCERKWIDVEPGKFSQGFWSGKFYDQIVVSCWISFLAKRGLKKRSQCCLNHNASKYFLYFIAI